jgi:hypothetical protein
LCTKHYTIHMVAISVTLISETTKRKEDGTERKARRRAKKSNTCHSRGGGNPVLSCNTADSLPYEAGSEECP